MSKTLEKRGVQAIGKYQVVAKIANGAHGTVLKGQDPATGKVVAIKFASVALAKDKVLLTRFEQEFRTTNTLNHPNIVRALEFGWEGTRPFIVMEYVDGEDMGTRIERLGQLAEAEAVGFIEQVARGLHEAHKHGIIHRDIKPDNILLTKDGQAKLADLGLSKDLETDLELTRPDRGLGTPNFIAPEQFGDAKHAGVRCDIYGLGATLYMALTGELPFAGRSLLATMTKKLADELTPPQKLVPGLSERVDWAVRRAVLAEPERRFASCPEFVAALTSGQTGPLPVSTVQRSTSGHVGARRSAAPDKDRRANVRYECVLPSNCTMSHSLHENDSEWQTEWNAQVVNLSIRGIGLLLARRVEPRTVLTVELKNSSGDLRRTRELTVVRVKPGEGGRWYVGATFSEKLSKEELRQLL